MKKILLAAFQFFLVSSFLFAQPANDICFNAIEIINLDNNCINFTIQDATNNITNGDCVNDSDAANVWYKFTAQGNQLDLTGDGPNANVVFATLVEFNQTDCEYASANQLACGSADGGGNIFSYSNLVEGQEYYLIMNVNNDDVGNAEFCIDNPLVTPPTGGPCNPQMVMDDCGSIESSTIDAMYDIDITGYCAPSSESGVYYEFTVSEGNYSVYIDVLNLSSGGNVTAVLGTWSSDCNDALSIIDFYCGPATSNLLEASNLVAGSTYIVFVGTSVDDQGTFDLRICGQQPPSGCAENDLCEDVQFFPGVGSGSGYVCVEGCNIGASPEPNLPGCNMSTEEVVWYRFTTDTEAALASINISSEDIEAPTVQVFVGESCSNLTQQTNCVTGSNYSAQIINFYVQEQTVYWIAVSNAYGNGGVFDLCVQTISNPSSCVLETNLEVVSTSLGSPLEGPFQPNEEVQFCYTINSYSSSNNNCQWLQGIIPIFGCGWSEDSFDENGMPTSIPTPLTAVYGGEWSWYTDVTYNNKTSLKSVGDFDEDGVLEMCHYSEPYCANSGLNPGDIMPPGWFNANPADGPPSGHPNVDYGDGNACNTTMGPWTVCFTLETNSESACGSCGDASVKIYTTADGETGSWNGASSICVNDVPQIFQAVVECCSAPILDEPLTQIICSGETSFLELKSNNGDASISYTYSPISNTSISGAMSGEGAFITQTLINSSTEMATQIYEVIAIDESGCGSSPQQVTIDVLPQITVDAGIDIQLCEPGEIVLGGSPTASGGGGEPFTFAWSNPDFGDDSNPTASPNLSTTYVVTVTDTEGCMSSDEVNITLGQIMQVQIAGDTTVCQSDTLELSAIVSGGQPTYTYEWAGTGISGNDEELIVDASTLELGMIQITLAVSDINGCMTTVTRSIEIVQSSEIVFNSEVGLLCPNGSITIEASVNPPNENYNYTWNGPEGAFTGPIIDVMTVGEYTLSIQDNYGCQDIESIVVEESKDLAALMALYNSAYGENWTNNTGWKDGAESTNCDPCDGWYGVTCDGNGRVTKIILEANNLQGTITSELGALTKLKELNLSNNYLTGNIPSEIGELEELISVILNNNDLSGCVSGNIVEVICNLNSADISYNPLLPWEGNMDSICLNLPTAQIGATCSVNGELGIIQEDCNCVPIDNDTPHPDCASLSALYNSMGGTNWTNNAGWSDGFETENCDPCDGWYGVTCDGNGRVIEINLASNNLVGVLPSEIQEITMLQELNLAQNNISGNIPEEIVELADLTSLLINSNAFSGCIEESVLEKICSLDTKDVSGNPLLPWEGNTNTLCMNESSDQVGAPCNLNGEEGEIDENCDCIPNTGAVHLDCAPLMAFYNSTGGIDWTNNTGWSNGADSTNCDPCDGWYGVTCNEQGRVTELILEANNLEGIIPSEISKLTKLTNISLSTNILTGEVPSSMGSLKKLKNLNLSKNDIFGNIPKELGQLSELTALSLNNNQFSGEIPAELGDLALLNVMDLSSNSLIGEIPSSLGDLKEITKLYLHDNYLLGCYDANLMELCDVVDLDFTNNPLLPWEGDFEKFCATDGSEAAQEDAPCNDGNPDNGMEDKIVDCVCTGNVSTSEEDIKELIFFPNPVNNQIYIKGLESGKYRMIDLYGRTVVNGHFRHSINVEELMEGMYILQVYNGQHWQTGAIQILRTE